MTGYRPGSVSIRMDFANIPFFMVKKRFNSINSPGVNEVKKETLPSSDCDTKSQPTVWMRKASPISRSLFACRRFVQNTRKCGLC